MARLQALLVYASPELRARIVRLLRREIRRLQRGGLTSRERAAVRRLRQLIGAIHRVPVVNPITTATFPLARLATGGGLSVTVGGVLSAAGAEDGVLRASKSPRGAARLALPKGPRPAPGSSSSSNWPLLLALALAGLLFLVLASAMPRDSLHSVARGFGTLASPDTLALGMVVLLGLLLGTAVTLVLTLFP